MYQNENVQDAADDICDILTQWNDLLLLEYNRVVHENNQFDTFRRLLDNSGNQDMRTKIGVAQALGGVTLDKLYEMGAYKLA